jgi:pSer/pThr/pTyr-binding forkhead associated (FHA) protein
MPFFLKILIGPAEDKVGMKIALSEGEHMLGRATPPCDIHLDSVKVSKKHALLRVKGSDLQLEDLNSANGIFVNGKRVTATPLREKDRIAIGEFVLEVTVKK